MTILSVNTNEIEEARRSYNYCRTSFLEMEFAKYKGADVSEVELQVAYDLYREAAKILENLLYA